jgi:hypothetical protein
VGIDKPGVAGQEHLWSDAHLDGRLDAHVVQKDIRPVDELQEDLHPLVVLEVQHHALLVAVVVFKIVVVPAQACHGADDLHEPPGRVAGRGLDLDHIRAQVPQSHPGHRALLKHRNLNDSHILQRSSHRTSSLSVFSGGGFCPANKKAMGSTHGFTLSSGHGPLTCLPMASFLSYLSL